MQGVIGARRAIGRGWEVRSRKAREGRKGELAREGSEEELHGYAKEHHGGGRNYPC